MVFLELTGILPVWRDCTVKGRDSQIHMQVMEMEIGCREKLHFAHTEVTMEPPHCPRKQMGEMHRCSAGVWVSRELGRPQKELC